MRVGDTDPFLHRLEQNALAFCLLSAGLAAVVSGGRAALGIVGGGTLVGVSYWAIKSGVDGIMAAIVPDKGYGARARHRAHLGWTLFAFTSRYALLGLIAYVMISRLHLHAIGLLIGASSVVAAAVIEAIRTVAGPRASQREN